MTTEFACWQAGIACAGLVNRLYLALDEHDYSSLERLFTPDAEWVRLGERTVGLDAIQALMQKRPADLSTRHVIANPVVDLREENHAQGSFYMLVVRKSGVTPGIPLPLPVDSFWRLSVVQAEFRRTEAGWRIARQRTESQFEFVSEATQ
jgi:ketosteroid isomerase-like protein